MKKILFIDRDGTLVVEPSQTKQINGLEDLLFLPNVISSLKKLSENGYELIIVTNQDGLGTKSNTLENYHLVNRKIFEILQSESVSFSQIFECPHFEVDNCECRKPKTGMLNKYLQENIFDKDNSFMIGDRQTDMDFAKNLGIRSYFIPKWDWKSITDDILNKPRISFGKRKTAETDISIKLNLDGNGIYKINTGLKFFDHMLEQFSKHGCFDLDIFCKGDLQIDEHHTIEDTAILLGDVFKKALGDKRGIERYAWERILVMDEAKTEVSLDLSGRPYLIYNFQTNREYVGDFPTEMLKHFFQSFCDKAGLNLSIEIYGENTHHMIESSFKAFAKCLKDAVKKTSNTIVSTKGTL